MALSSSDDDKAQRPVGFLASSWVDLPCSPISSADTRATSSPKALMEQVANSCRRENVQATAMLLREDPALNEVINTASIDNDGLWWKGLSDDSDGFVRWKSGSVLASSDSEGGADWTLLPSSEWTMLES